MKDQTQPQDNETESETRFHRRFIWLVIGLAALSLWVRPMFSPLWTDELGTWWVVKGTFAETVARAREYQGQSPLYYMVAWATRVMGHSEPVLRLPSLVAGVGAAYLLYRLAARLVDTETARLSVLAFVTWQTIAFVVSDFRPYAIGVLLVVASTLTLVRWLDTRKLQLAAVYVALTVLTVWTHYLLALALVAHVPYVWMRVREQSTSVEPRFFVTAVGLFTLGVLPLVGQLLSLWHRRSSLGFRESVGLDAFIRLIAPQTAIGGLVFGVVLAMCLGRVFVRVRPVGRATLLLVCAWLFIPSLTFLIISQFSPYTFATGRYLISAAPAGAILLGWGLRCLEPASVRRVVATTLVIVAILIGGNPVKAGEDWRRATTAVRAIANDDTLVLVHPGLVESSQLEWFTMPERRDYLLSPLSYYPIAGRIVLLPAELDVQSEQYLIAELRQQLPSSDRLVLLTRFPSVPYRAWLEGRLASDGWVSHIVGDYGVIDVVSFERA